jgi:dephospho-CoA kinase
VKIAITGGLGTGKSTVAKILASTLETTLIDTDQLCRRQMLPGTEGYEEFGRVFGQKYLQDDGTVDRVLLRQAVFEDAALREKLENILHPIVRRQVAILCKTCSSHAVVSVVEVPLLYEVGWQADFDVCIVVYVPEDICVQRVMLRDEMAAEEIMQIMHSQIPIKKKLDYADFIVDNAGIFVSTVQQTYRLARMFTRK